MVSVVGVALFLSVLRKAVVVVVGAGESGGVCRLLSVYTAHFILLKLYHYFIFIFRVF